jgi:hypothetical protein
MRARLRGYGYGLAAAGVLAPLLAGCGIRTTSVPVDAGPAPSRVSCTAPKAPANSEPDAVTRQVFLVCSMQVAPVSRSMVLRDARIDWFTRVSELVAQLQASPMTDEGRAGFSTAVPSDLRVTGARAGDPRDALRLNEAPDALPPFALGQLVCTLTADPVVSPDQQVVIGGPAKNDGLRVYSCTSDLRTGADDAGTPL